MNVYAVRDENYESDLAKVEYEMEHGYKDYSCLSDAFLHDDSLYEESGEIYKYLEEKGLLPDGKLITINEVEQMIVEKEKQEGLTEEIKSGESVNWENLEYTFKPAISSHSDDSTSEKISKVSVDFLHDVADKYPNYCDVSEVTNRNPKDYETVILFHTDEDVKDFKVYSLEITNSEEMGDEDFIPMYKRTEIYRTADFKKDTPIAVPLSFPTHFANNGFSYKDTDGKTKAFIVDTSESEPSVEVSPMHGNILN